MPTYDLACGLAILLVLREHASLDAILLVLREHASLELVDGAHRLKFTTSLLAS
jgi:hypothetical protein